MWLMFDFDLKLSTPFTYDPFYRFACSYKWLRWQQTITTIIDRILKFLLFTFFTYTYMVHFHIAELFLVDPKMYHVFFFENQLFYFLSNNRQIKSDQNQTSNTVLQFWPHSFFKLTCGDKTSSKAQFMGYLLFQYACGCRQIVARQKTIQ